MGYVRAPSIITNTTTMRLIATFAVLLISFTVDSMAQTLPQDDASHYSRGIDALQRREFDVARVELFSTIRDSAKHAEAWYALGFVGLGLRDYDLVIRAGRNLSTLQPHRPEAWYFQTIGYNERRTMDSLVFAARRFQDLDPVKAREANIPKILESLSQDSVGIRDSTFTTPDNTVQISLPASWSTRHLDDGKTLNWFVSLEPIHKSDDMFSTGVSIHWIRRLSESFRLDGNTDAEYIAGFWEGYTSAQEKITPPYYHNKLDSIHFRRSEWRGVVATTDLQLTAQSHRLRKYGAIIARENELFLISLECPIENWSIYEKRFRKAIDSLVLPK